MAQVFKITSAACKKVMQREIGLTQTEAMEMTVPAFLGSLCLQDLPDALTSREWSHTEAGARKASLFIQPFCLKRGSVASLGK